MRTWRYITLLMSALSMAMAFCHLLEMPARMEYEAALYVQVTHTLYQLFGTVGAFIEMGAIVCGIVLTVIVRRRRPTCYFPAAGTACLVLAFVTWLLFVAPANAIFATWTPASVPSDWMSVRNQWEYGHAARAALLVAGFSLFVWSVLIETPSRAS